VESGPVDLVFDTRGGEVPAGERVVTIAEEMPGAIYFIVEADHEQLTALTALVDAGELRAEALACLRRCRACVDVQPSCSRISRFEISARSWMRCAGAA
jgi:hypothetical protein